MVVDSPEGIINFEGKRSSCGQLIEIVVDKLELRDESLLPVTIELKVHYSINQLIASKLMELSDSC